MTTSANTVADSLARVHRPVAAVVLAAGKGTRMRSQTPKVLHPLLGRTILDWVLTALAPLSPARTVVVVGHGADEVRASLEDHVRAAVQREQLGSGDALAAALPDLTDFDGDVLVVNGDGALFTAETLAAVLEGHRSAASRATTLAIRSAADLPYGRVVQGPDARVERIVEAVDASEEELALRELNAGVYCFDAASLRASLPRLDVDNAKGEYYITDLFSIAREAGERTLAVVAGGEEELLGVNTRADLAKASRLLQRRIVQRHMLEGVRIELPDSCIIEPTVTIEADATIEPGCMLHGSTLVEAGAVVGPDTTLVDTRVEQRARVVRSHCIEAHVGYGASVGPFSYLRPGATLAAMAKAGAFVEVKNATIGERSKVPHLSYIGDASIGCDTNIGAGTITANYRPELGTGKQRTTIGDNVRTGSDNVFVAPVTLADGSFTAAGSIVTDDVPAGALAIARARQVNLADYGRRLRQRQPEASK